MARHQFNQKVVIKETWEIKKIWYQGFPFIFWYMTDDTVYRESEFFAISQPWKQNSNVADVLPSAAHTANRAIERMISQ